MKLFQIVRLILSCKPTLQQNEYPNFVNALVYCKIQNKLLFKIICILKMYELLNNYILNFESILIRLMCRTRILIQLKTIYILVHVSCLSTKFKSAIEIYNPIIV